MSLINQMLRDLEKRRAAESGVTQSGPIAVTLGAGRTRRRMRLVLVLSVLGIGAAAAGYWLAVRSPVVTVSSEAVPAAQPAPAAAVQPPTPTPPAPAPELTLIEPDSVVGSDSAGSFTVIGNGLNAQSHVILSWRGGTRQLGSEEITLEGNDRLTFTLTTGTAPDIWTVQVVQPDGRASNLLALRVTAPPVVETARAPSEAKPRKKRAATSQEESEKAVVEPIEKRVRPLSDVQQADQAYQAAYKLLQQGRRDEAEHALREVVSNYPQHVASREALVALLLAAGRKVEAQELLVDGLTRTPAHAPFALLLGRLQLETGNSATALATMEKARAAGARSAELDAFVAALYQQQKRFAESIAAYQSALTGQPAQGNWWVGLAISCEGAGQRDEALAAYQRALTATSLETRLRSYAEKRIAALKQ